MIQAIKNVVKLFAASIYDIFISYFFTIAAHQIIINHMHLTAGNLLDIGCGTGHHVGSMGEQNLNILGIDISPSMIQKAKETYPNYDFRVANALNMSEFNDQSFTHILCLYFNKW